MSEENSTRDRRLRQLLTVFGPFLGLLFIYAAFFVYDFVPDGELEKFARLFGVYNLKIVARHTTIVAVAALGMTVVIISGGIDLSAGSVIALVTVVVALCLNELEPDETAEAGSFLAASWAVGFPLVAILAGIGAALATGFINGSLITRLSIVPFIVTLGMLSVARGTAKFLADEQKVNAPETWINELLAIGSDDPFWRLPPGIVLLLALSLFLALVLRYGVFGRYVFAIGSNESTAHLCGIRVARQKVLVYMIAGVFTGIAGVMEFSELTVGDPTTAVGKELDIIAAVVIGGGSLSGGRGGVLGTLIGAFILGVLRNGCDLYDIPNTVQEIVIGVIIVSAAAVDQLQQRRRT